MFLGVLAPLWLLFRIGDVTAGYKMTRKPIIIVLKLSHSMSPYYIYISLQISWDLPGLLHNTQFENW